LTYQEKFFRLPWNGETHYFVTDAEVLPMTSTRNSLPGIEPQYQESLPESTDREEDSSTTL
jgi:hypothetical protein